MRLYVLARNFADFKKWCWEKNVPVLHATYVANAERLSGPGQIIRVKGHEENINSAAIEEALAVRTSA